MPNNFRHVGLIHLMLPNAQIIDARREPMACCFSNFKQLFAKGQEFTYSIEDIARYYRTYLELMRHWDRVLPGRMLRVYHEDVVEDLEGNVRRMLDFCGLEFEPQCVAFHETRRSVRTASSEQVRQAIYREGLDQWRHFEPWLGPLKRCPRGCAEPLPRCRNMTMNPGRNDPCPCGSGRKFKHCHGVAGGALRQAPGSHGRELTQLVTMLHAGALAAVEQRCRALLGPMPGDGMLWKILSVALLRQGRDALPELRRAVQLLPGDAETHMNLGIALAAAGRQDDALTSYRHALTVNPASVEALNNLGTLLRDRGEPEEALSVWRQAVTLDPRRAESHWNLGNVLFDLRRLDQAAAAFRDALALEPASAQALLGLAAALRMRGRAAEAEERCRAALAIEPKNVEGLSLLGELHADRGQFAEAQELFERALALNPALPAGVLQHGHPSQDDQRRTAPGSRSAEGLLAKPLPLGHVILCAMRSASTSTTSAGTMKPSTTTGGQRAHQALPGAAIAGRNFTQLVNRIIDTFDAKFMQRAARHGWSDSELPVLIIGMPRSGTSLAEQILASHPAVFGGGELRFWDGAFGAFESGKARGASAAELLPQISRDYLERILALSQARRCGSSTRCRPISSTPD